jgi:peptide/nickel transport system substrate-binding protein
VEPTPERQRPPRPKRQPQVLRVSMEIGACVVILIVALALLGVVLHAAPSASKPPQDTVVVTQSQDFTTLDPALAQTPDAWELEYATCAKLLNYPPRVGYRGTKLVPEVATALPTVSPDRLTYTFHLRSGWQFSDGTPVTAASFARTFERARSPELVSPADTYLREVRSWHASGQTLTIHLSTPAPDFVQRLALPYFCAVPSTAPNEQRDNLPSAGPFAIASYAPGRSLLLRRNPYYHGPRKTYVRQIVYRFGAFPSEIRLQLERGEADYGVVTPTSFAELAQKFKGDKTHLFVVQQPIVAFLALNTQRPLFKDNPWLRRAVNYALDRPTLAGLFGLDGAKPSDEYLPPGFPGYEPKHVYPIDGPDLPAARRLAEGHLRGGHATYLACGSQSCVDRALVVAQALGKIGLHVDVQTSPGGSQLTLAAVRGTHFDITDVITRPDYGDPYALVDKLLDSRAIRSVGNTNLSYFASPSLNHAIDEAQQLSGVARDRAYGRLGLAVEKTDAPLAAYAVLNARVFLSKRVDCVTYQPVYGLDLAGLCLR